ncbi:MAG TPA: hypothetical protein VFE94_02220 [Candidatus Paceibacterota bacterium]|nr:hypothetical protein [Candidatus Paceibacterota bacterium]
MNSLTKASTSVYVFGIYMIGQGLTLLLAPNMLLQFMQLPETNEVWTRLLGVTLMVLGYYYIRAARVNFLEFFGWTVHMRLAQFGIVGALVLLNIAHPLVLGFAAVEAASGLWTFWALRK